MGLSSAGNTFQLPSLYLDLNPRLAKVATQ
uniref:Uncharacterized protein n=1 Tax=Arundo donax TaxID=35708 RepID=A0A0A9FSD5_ARUDO